MSELTKFVFDLHKILLRFCFIVPATGMLRDTIKVHEMIYEKITVLLMIDIFLFRMVCDCDEKAHH